MFGPIKRRIKEYRYRSGLPDPSFSSDIFLVSFPKSGNTWMRFLLASVMKRKVPIDCSVNWFTIGQMVPDVGVSRSLPPRSPFWLEGFPRIIKSHASYNPYYLQVILLVRDPRDVMLSFYHYLRSEGRLAEDVSMGEFIGGKKKGIDAWIRHTDSWLSNHRPGQTIRLFRYEDVKHNPFDTLKTILDLIGLKSDDKTVSQVVEECSPENMRALEKTTRSTCTEGYREPFVRAASVGEGRELSDEDRSFIAEKAGPLMKRLGYAPS